MHPLKVVAGQDEVALQQRDIAEVEVGVGKRLVITALGAALSGSLVELAGTV